MATLEWGETFDHYQFNTLSANFSALPIATKWTGIDVDSSVLAVSPEYARPGAAGGCGFQVQSSRWIYKTLPGGAQATRCLAFWWNPVTGNASNGLIIAAFLDVTSEQLSIRLDGTGHLVVSRNGTTLATSTNTFSASTWYWIEFKATINNSTGVYEVKVNGTSTNWIPQATGANTRATANNSATGIRIGNSSNVIQRYDDVVVADDFTGQLQGAFLRPAGPGAYADFTPNSGSNDGAVRSPFTDGDNSFNASVTSGDIDTFAMEKLPAGGTPTILGVQHVILAKQDAGVQRTLRPKQRSSSTDYDGTSVNTGTTYAYITEAKPTNPATAVAWTKSSLEAAEFGYENV